jgi:hypothetical protein
MSDRSIKKTENLLWSIPAIALYFYTATVLMQYGYASYFNIPSNFISASLSDNIIYFFQLYAAAQYEVGFIRWWVWIVLGLIAIFIALLYFSNALWRKIISFAGTVIFFFMLLGFYSFGKSIGSLDTTFWMPSTSCPPIGSDARYIIPLSLGTDGVFVPIDQQNKMTGGFLVENLATLNCKLVQQPIGKITN